MVTIAAATIALAFVVAALLILSTRRSPGMLEFWFGAVTSYLLFEDSAAGDASVLAAHTAVGQVRENMIAVLLAVADAPDTVMLLFITADATKDPAVHYQPLPRVATTIRARAKELADRTLSSHENLIGLRQRLFEKSREYEKGLGGVTRPDPSVFVRLDPEAMARLIKFYS